MNRIIRISLFLTFTFLGMAVGMLGHEPIPVSASSSPFELGLAQGEMDGAVIAIPLLAFLIIQLVKSIKKTPKYSLGLFIVATLFLCFGQFYKSSKFKISDTVDIASQNNLANSNHRQEDAQFSIFLKEISNGKILTDDQLQKMNLGSLYNFATVMNRHNKKILEINSNYQDTVRSIEGALEVRNLENKQSVKKYKADLTSIKELILSYKQEVSHDFNIFESEARDSIHIAYGEPKTEFDRGCKEGMIVGLEKATKRERKYWNDFFNIEEQIIQTIQNIYSLLSESEGYFTFNNGELLFHHEADAMRYNNLIITLNELSTKEAQLNQEKINSKKAALNKIEENVQN